MAQVVYTGASEGASGSLFSGQKFWLSATVPQKLTIRDYIQVSMAPILSDMSN